MADDRQLSHYVDLGDPQSGIFGYYGPRISARSLDTKYFDTNNLL